MNLVERIKSQTKYTKSNTEKSFSGSQFGNTLLQNYLGVLFPNKDDGTIGQSDIGSIFHKGLETINDNYNLSDEFDDSTRPQLMSEVSLLKLLPNGWTLTGTLDLIDIQNQSIHDYKLTKKYAGKSVKKDFMHSYNIQLRAYRYIHGQNYRPFLEMFYKDADAALKEPAYESIEVLPDVDFEQHAIKVTNELEAALDSGEMPAECSIKDKWPRKLKNGNTIMSRCEVYCSVSDNCPYFNEPSLRTSMTNW